MSSAGQVIGGVVGAVAGFFIGGGPQGALIGAQIGMGLGGMIDPPKGPKIMGPRLSDLTTQTSTYGIAIPRAYGTVPIVGNVFWLENNRLKETEHTQSQGKGGGGAESHTFTYSATFAVGLCEGPIAGIRRIWIGANLVYDAGASDIQSAMASGEAAANFKVYYGDDAQLPDPRMQSTLGMANTPAFRGLAYIVFYDLELANYQNSLVGAQVKAEVVKAGTAANIVSVGSVVVTPGATAPSATAGNVVSSGILVDGEKSYLQTGDSYSGSQVNGRIVTVIANALGATNSFAVNLPPNDLPIPGQSDIASYAVGGDSSVVIDGAVLSLPYEGYFVLNTRYIKTGVLIYLWNEQNSTLFLFQNGVLMLTKVIAGGVDLIKAADGNILMLINDGTITKLDSASLLVISTTNFGLPTTGYSLAQSSLRVDEDGVVWVIKNATLYRLGASAIDASYALPITFNPNINSWAVRSGVLAYLDGSTGSLNYYKNSALSSIDTPLSTVISAECLKTNLLASSDIDVTALTSIVHGYTISSIAAIRSGFDPLIGAWPFDVIQSGYKIVCKPRGGSSVATIPIAKLDARSIGSQPGVQVTNAREMDSVLPSKVALKYFDVDREYNTGEQYAERLNTQSVNVSAMDLPIVLSSDEAAKKAEILLYLYWLERYDVSFKLPAEFNDLEPSDVITIVTSDATYVLRLTQINYTSDGRLECQAKYNNAAVYISNAVGGVGASAGQILTLAGPSQYELLDIPLLKDAFDTAGFPVAMAGYLAGWPSGILMRSDDFGQTWAQVQGFSRPGSTMGYAINSLSAHNGLMIDKASTLHVMMNQALSSVTELQMLNGANHFAYGLDGRWEIIAAQNCVLQADGSYIFTDLLRGRFGSEWASGLHASTDHLVLLNTASLQFVTSNLNVIGMARTYRGITTGKTIDSDGNRTMTYNGVNLKCLSPVYLNGNRDPSTHDWALTWLRRTRKGGEMRDLVDVPLSEASESYSMDIFADGTYATVKRTLTAMTPTVSYTSAQQAADFGSNQATLYIKVYQISATTGRGYPLTTSITR